MNRISLGLAAAAAALLLAGCAGTSATLDPGTGASVDPGTSTPSDPGASETPAAEEPGDGTAAFGKTYTYDDGLKVTVSKPVKTKIPAYSATEYPKGVAYSFKVKVTNGTGETFDATFVQVETVGGEEGDSGDQVFGGKFGEGFSGKITNDRNKTAPYLFAWAKGTDVSPMQVQLTPGLDYDTVIFEGSVG